jgi:uncharacterized protein YjiS (DUF1127 family)
MTGATLRTSDAALPLRSTLLHRMRGHVSALLGAMAEGLSRAAINARVVRQLGAMSERELKDIGLVRQDVYDAAALDRGGDSTDLLLARRAERKAARRV